MKKLVRVLSVLTLTLCLGLALTACAKEEGKYVGKTGEAPYEATVTVELKDGNYTMTAVMGGEEVMKSEGTYKIKGDKFTATPKEGGDTIEGTIKKGKSMTFTIEGVGEVTLNYQK